MNLPASTSPADRRWWPVVAGTVAIALAVAIAYAPALRGGWVWDDDSEIVSNATVKDPAGLGRIWNGAGTVDYFPLKTTFQWLQWRAWGDNPFPYHVTNVALHALSALLVWHLLARLGLRCGWVGGLLFAVHPLGVESVAWIAEFKNAVSLPPLLMSAAAYLVFLRTRGPAGYAISLLLFVVAALCKSSVVMLPPVLLLLAWWSAGRLDRRDVLAAVPFFVVALVLGIVTIWFQHVRAIAHWELPAASMVERLGRAGAAAVFYLGKSVLPVGLQPLYPRSVPDSSPLVQVVAWIGIGATLFVAWRARRSWGRHALLGFGWFGLNLLPVLGLVNMSYLHFAWVADHFAYVSLVGVVGLGTAIIEIAWRQSPAARWLVPLAVLGIAVAGIQQSRRHAALYRSEETLWTHVLHRQPDSVVAHNNLAVALVRKQQFDAALERATTALRLAPDYVAAHENVAIALAGLGRIDDAARALAEAERRGGRSAAARVAVGTALLRAGRVAEAIARYEAALVLNPEDADAHKGIAVALYLTGRIEEAIPHYRRALQLAPDAATHTNCGVALVAAGRAAEAVAHYREALQLAPAAVETHYSYGIALVRLGRPAEARAEFETALRLNPAHAEARAQLEQLGPEKGRAP